MTLDPIEQGLRRALEREEPPDAFADRVIAQLTGVNAEVASLSAGRRFRRARTALAIAASLVVAVAGWQYERRQAAIRDAEIARGKVELALRVTAEQLNRVQMKLAEISERRVTDHEDRQ
jgi:hypothetical protein